MTYQDSISVVNGFNLYFVDLRCFQECLGDFSVSDVEGLVNGLTGHIQSSSNARL